MVYHKPEDFAAFERVLAEGLRRYPVELFTYSLMPNHWLCQAPHKTCYVKLHITSGWPVV